MDRDIDVTIDDLERTLRRDGRRLTRFRFFEHLLEGFAGLGTCTAPVGYVQPSGRGWFFPVLRR